MTNIGLKDTRKKYLEQGMAIEIVPKSMTDFGIINDIDQQRAIMHNIYIHLGFAKDVDEKDLLPIARTNLDKKSVVIIMIPLIKDEVTFMQVAGSTPVLDSDCTESCKITLSKGKQSAYKKKPLFLK